MTDVINSGARRYGVAAVRAYTRWGLLVSVVVLSIPAMRTVVQPGRPDGVVALLSLALIATAGAHATVSFWALRSGVSAAWPPLVALALAVPAFAAHVVLAPAAAVPWAVVVGVGLSALLIAREWRRVDVGLVLAFVVAVGVAATVAGVPPEAAVWTRPGLVAGALALAPVVDASQMWILRTIQRLEAARALGVELATTRERARIGAELHDVQGHTMHLIAMHAELVERLVLDDPMRARDYARTVRTLAADALAETRSLVHGYRASDVAAEVRNAAEVLRAAGTEVAVRGDPALLPASAGPLFAPLVREATTNIVRHSAPRHVEFTVTRTDGQVGLTIANDGVRQREAESVDGTGLAGLRSRFEGEGGSFAAGEDPPGTWTVTGAVPLSRPDRREA